MTYIRPARCKMRNQILNCWFAFLAADDGGFGASRMPPAKQASGWSTSVFLR
jgi:hypothetical protein